MVDGNEKRKSRGEGIKYESFVYHYTRGNLADLFLLWGSLCPSRIVRIKGEKSLEMGDSGALDPDGRSYRSFAHDDRIEFVLEELNEEPFHGQSFFEQN